MMQKVAKAVQSKQQAHQPKPKGFLKSAFNFVTGGILASDKTNQPIEK
jgi:hypothetical protein